MKLLKVAKHDNINKAHAMLSTSVSAATPSISRRAISDYYTPYPYKSIGMPHESEMS